MHIDMSSSYRHLQEMSANFGGKRNQKKKKERKNRASLVATESLQCLQQQKLSCSMYFNHLLQRLNVYQSMRVNINTLQQSLNLSFTTSAIYEDITI